MGRCCYGLAMGAHDKVLGEARKSFRNQLLGQRIQGRIGGDRTGVKTAGRLFWLMSC